MAGGGGSTKRPPEAEKENLERWLLTYSDMITLLMLFFVVLYSMSTINPKKFEDLSQILTTIFAGGRIEIFESKAMSSGEGIQDNPGYFPIAKSKTGKKEDIFKQTVSVLRPELQSRTVRVELNEEGVVITLASDTYFGPGSPKIVEAAIPILRDVSGVLKSLSNYVRVEGHTDTQPPSPQNVETNYPYRSNWELSAQRSINVLRVLESFEVPSQRLSAVAYGDVRPIEKNDTPEGRAYNRRVDIVIVQD
jgi:chemotaxis protein MotB